MSIGPGYAKVQAIDNIYPSLEMCKNSASFIRSELLSKKPTPESTVSAYCTEIPTEV